MRVPIIDIFAGPGGLGEGFSAARSANAERLFRIGLSVEKEPHAHRTLELRAFFRQFDDADVPDDYYLHLRGEIDRAQLFAAHPSEAAAAQAEAWNATLGDVSSAEVDRRVRAAIGDARDWVLVGGPPCQAYSLVGRSRNRGIDPADHRVFLYREYIRLLSKHRPPVFVMENVKGLLSAKVEGRAMIDRILEDLEDPWVALGGKRRSPASRRYKIFSLVDPEPYDRNLIQDARRYLVRCEEHGVAQTRHRVILVGVRADRAPAVVPSLQPAGRVWTVGNVIADLPSLRSGIGKGHDSDERWHDYLRARRGADWLKSTSIDAKVRSKVHEAIKGLMHPAHGRGADFIAHTVSAREQLDWFHDPRLGGVCNHSTRSHMPKDLDRYLFVSAYGAVHGRSPRLADFPPELLPHHANVAEGVDGAKFNDRFRVQLRDKPSKTVTSHISKDGHYFVHHNPRQCRSLTVREAARLQSFPDNYFFTGPRTAQYIQVGNAVPPLVARQIAGIVSDVLAAGAEGAARIAAAG